MSFVERFIIQCPYFGGSTIRGSTASSMRVHVFVVCVYVCVYMSLNPTKYDQPIILYQVKINVCLHPFVWLD